MKISSHQHILSVKLADAEVVRKNFVDDFYQVKENYTNLFETNNKNLLNLGNITHIASKLPNINFDKIFWVCEIVSPYRFF